MLFGERTPLAGVVRRLAGPISSAGRRGTTPGPGVLPTKTSAYKAIKDGEVSTVALIDKGSIVVAGVLAVWSLKEQVTAKTLAGAALMLAGLLIIARR